MSGLWSALQADLADFVSTLKEDTGKVASQVAIAGGNLVNTDIDATPESSKSSDATQRAEKDLIRSFETYASPPKASQRKKFSTFMKSVFSLKESSREIAALVEEEHDVCRYYVELVPANMTPETFWGRFFFRRGKSTASLKDCDLKGLYAERTLFQQSCPLRRVSCCVSLSLLNYHFS
jgi:hypothetical protein